MKEIYKCHLCGYKADTRHISCILTHLQDKHQITRGSRESGPTKEFTDYINKFMGNPLCACGCGDVVSISKKNMQFNLFSDNCKNKGKFNNPCRKEFYIFRGYKPDVVEEIISKLQSKEPSEEKRKLLSDINSGDKNPSSVKSIIVRYGKNGAKKYLRARGKPGKLNPFYGHKHTDETLKICAKAGSSCPRVSSIQIKLYEVLDSMQIKYFREREDGSDEECLIEKWPLDCVIPVGNTKLLIDCQGSYWHSLPKVQKRDRRKTYYIKHKTSFTFKKLYEKEFYTSMGSRTFNDMSLIKQKIMRWIDEIKNNQTNVRT